MPANEVGSVARLDERTIQVTYFNPPSEGGNVVRMLRSDDRNYQAYIDMVGGSLNKGEEKLIPLSIGRVTMLDDGSLLYEITESQEPLRPGAREYVKKGTERYASLLRKYPDLTPGHFRLVLSER